MKLYLLIVVMAIVSQLQAQNWPLKQAITDKKQAGQPFTRLNSFSAMGGKMQVPDGTYQQLQLSNLFIKKVMAGRPETMQLSIPLSAGETIDCDLIKVSPGTVKFTENNSRILSPVSLPVMYQGVVTGRQQKNNVVLTVNDDYVSLIAVMGDTSLQITKEDGAAATTYRLYNSANIQFPTYTVGCGTRDNSPRQTARDITAGSGMRSQTAVQDKCVFVYVDCFDSLYQWRGSSKQSTINYVYELFNLVMAGYLNDSVKVKLEGINIWTSADPYRQPNRETAIKDLCYYYKDNFWGNICLGLDYSTNGRSGIASKIGKVKAVVPNSCAAYNESDSTGACAYCDQNYGGSYQNFPTGASVTQAQLYQVMHEIGHLLGAHHTQWCGWLLSQNPDVYGAIDNCAPVETVNGNTCTPGPPPGSSGGSIMSYCNNAPAFINYNNGFGVLPGNTVRRFVAGNQCIPLCIDCPGATGRLNNVSGLQEYLAAGITGADNRMAHADRPRTLARQEEQVPKVIKK